MFGTYYKMRMCSMCGEWFQPEEDESICEYCEVKKRERDAENERLSPKCTCGGTKLGLTHSDWCDYKDK